MSEWNKLGLWTGWTDVDLAPEGKEEARRAANFFKDLTIDVAHTSDLKRAKQTFAELQEALQWTHLAPTVSSALNERHYGVYTGKVKEEVRREVGDEEYKKIRRGYAHPIPEGESLKEVEARIVPYFESAIVPELRHGKNVLVVAHGNSLRALVKHLECVDDEAISDVHIETGEMYRYDFDSRGSLVGKQVLKNDA